MNSLKELKILSIGNSFSVDTMRHIPDIALALGVEKICFGNLFIGGCSINRHYSNIQNNAAEYVYYKNMGDGWAWLHAGKIILSICKAKDRVHF